MLRGEKINLSWQDNSNNEQGFKIERSLDGITFTQIDTVGADVTIYSDIGLNTGTTYYYRVRAYNSNGNSMYTNIASATTLPWLILIVDSTTDSYSDSSIALDTNNKVHVSYLLLSLSKDLRYATNKKKYNED
jgi:hypothetical protein